MTLRFSYLTNPLTLCFEKSLQVSPFHLATTLCQRTCERRQKKPRNQLNQKNWQLRTETWASDTRTHTHTPSRESADGKKLSMKNPKKTNFSIEREREVAKIVFVSGCIHWFVMMDVVGRDMLWSSFGCLHPTLKTITHTREPQYIYTFASLSLLHRAEKQTNYRQLSPGWNLECPVASAAPPPLDSGWGFSFQRWVGERLSKL